MFVISGIKKTPPSMMRGIRTCLNSAIRNPHACSRHVNNTKPPLNLLLLQSMNNQGNSPCPVVHVWLHAMHIVVFVQATIG